MAGISEVSMSALSFTGGMEDWKLGELPVSIVSKTFTAAVLCGYWPYAAGVI